VATYLVTGGAGFIGSHLVGALLARGERVRLLDNFSTGLRGNLAQLDGAEVVEGDIRSYHTVREAVDGVHFVFHVAALPSVPRSIRDPITSNDVNVVGTLNLLNASRDAKVARLLYASSSSIYGKTPELPKRETMRPLPISPYAVSKLAGENYCRAFWELYRFETVALRLFNVFGPRQDPDSQYSAVIPRFIRAALAGEAVPIYGDGQQTRDFTYVDNVVDAYLRAAAAPGVAGEVFNVAGGARHSLLDLVAALERVLDRPVATELHPHRMGDVTHSVASIDAARNAFGYQPVVEFEPGLARTVAATKEAIPEPLRA
jgi:UDP-glucose 4-epimerase